MRQGARFSEEHRLNISKRLTGRKLSEQHRKNMSEAKKGKTSNCAKSVKIIYKNIEYNFDTMTDAEKYFHDNLGVKIFYWLRRNIPQKHINDVQLIQIGDFIKHQQSSKQSID